MAVDKDAYLESIISDSAAVAAALDADTQAQVTSCPGWDVQALAAHLGRVHRFWTAQVQSKLSTGGRVAIDDQPTDGDSAWFIEGASELVEALEATEPDTPCWNWSGRNQTARWAIRRMAQETAVHRWDAQSAGVEPDPIDVEIAIDGIDEVFDMFMPAALEFDEVKKDDADLGGTIHLHATDSPHGEWLVQLSKGELLVGHDHAKGDVAARGTASDLLLFLWGRVPAYGLEMFGDEAILDRWFSFKIFD